MIAEPFVWGAGGAKLTPEEIARRREMEDKKLAGGVDTSPVGHWTQGAARVADALAGVVRSKRLDKAANENASYNSDLMSGLMGGGGSAPAPSQTGGGEIGTTPEAYRNAIASIESAGSGDYAAVGPTHPKLGRALGRYQIMEANVGPWSQEVLGRPVSAEEFMENPELQDQIFDAKFGSYVQQFGPEGAAQAWFGGPGGVGKTERKDVLGTSVGDYGQKFTNALGGSSPAPQRMQLAQAVQDRSQKLLGVLADPRATDATKRVAQALYQQEMQRIQSQQQRALKLEDRNAEWAREDQRYNQDRAFDREKFEYQQQNNALTGKIREYEYAKRQGFPGTLQEWTMAQKGGMSLQVDPQTGAVTFQQGANIKPLTEQQSKDTVFTTRAEGSLPTLNQYEQALTDAGDAIASGVPFVGNFITSEEFKKAEQSGREFLQAILRKDTGAAITADEEQQYGKTYLPRPGDTPEVMAQKRQSRQRALDAIKAGMPPAAILAQEKALQQQAQPPQEAPQVQVDTSGVLDKARAAIAAGAPREAVIKRLQDAGIDTGGL